MKRTIGLIFLFIICIVGFLTAKGVLPFIPVSGHGMGPTLSSGSLMMIKTINPDDVKVGDIIVYNVPTMVQEYYHYPPVVGRRVMEVKTVPTLGFITKGDNTGEDPFTIKPMDIRGTVSGQIPLLGLPLLVFQSQQGLIVVAIALVLLTIFFYASELLRGVKLVHRRLFSPMINKERRVNRLLTQKIEATEKKKGTTEPNHILTALAETMSKIPVKPKTMATRIEPLATVRQPSRYQKTVTMNRPVPPRYAKEIPETRGTIPSTRDIFLDRQELTKEGLAAKQEIFSALERLQSKLTASKSRA